MAVNTSESNFDCNANDLLHLRFIETAKRNSERLCCADSTGKELTFGRALVGAMLMGGWLRRQYPQETMIGVMLPATVGGVLVNIGVYLAGKIPINLNFTASEEAIDSAVSQCEIQTILTSRQFLDKAGLPERPGMVFLEDIIPRFSILEKLYYGMAAKLPTPWLLRQYRTSGASPDDLATVLFSSGSTGIPKGAMLTHRNIIANIDGARQAFFIQSSDCFMGVLPFFHAFGYTVTLWLPLLLGVRAVYHPNPMDAKTIGEMSQRFGVTILISTPTFFRSYIRTCSPEQFAKVRLAVVGAEKLRPAIRKDFENKFGVELLEGYGCTELGPVVSCNQPAGTDPQGLDHRPGTVGRPIPGVKVKIVHPETYEPLPEGDEGLLMVTGPSRMVGYLNQPELTDQVIRDGWYATGDIARLDSEGFITITDRLSRFSKIGGEMVPHIKIENEIAQYLDDAVCVVSAAPDEKRGEVLVVFHTQVNILPVDLWKQLRQSNLPPLWIPKLEHIYYIEELPTLGSGKLDLSAINRMARERVCGVEEERSA